MEAIYLDHSATIPTGPEVLGATMRYFANHYGNPSNIYRFGQEARRAVDEARGQVAALIGAMRIKIGDLDFSSFSTEDQELDYFNQPRFVLVNENFEFPDLLGAAYGYLEAKTS